MVDGKPLVCAIRMAFVKTDKPYIPGQKNTNPRAPHVDFLDSQAVKGKHIMRQILKGSEIKRMIDHKIQLIPVLENNKGWFTNKGMQLEKTKKNIKRKLRLHTQTPPQLALTY